MTQKKGVTHCPPALSCSALGVAHQSKQNFPLLPSYIPLKPNNCTMASEHINYQTTRRNAFVLLLDTLDEIQPSLRLLALPWNCFHSFETANTPRQNRKTG